jgi:hypothetical protein
MGGRWGGNIKGRRRGTAQQRQPRIWAPKPPKPAPRPDLAARGALLLSGAGAYLLLLAGALLTMA